MGIHQQFARGRPRTRSGVCLVDKDTRVATPYFLLDADPSQNDELARHHSLLWRYLLTGMRHHHPCPTTCSKLLTQNFGTRMFEGANLAAITDKVKNAHDPKDLLHLREILFEELSPPLTWLVKLSPLEWANLKAAQKELYSSMRQS
jgi:hypothetical protein